MLFLGGVLGIAIGWIGGVLGGEKGIAFCVCAYLLGLGVYVVGFLLTSLLFRV